MKTMKIIFILYLSILTLFATAQNGKYIGQVKINPITPGEALNYNIMSGNPNTAFRLDSKTGEIFINNQNAINLNGWNYTLSIRLRYSKNNVILRDSMVTFKITPQYAKLVNEIRCSPVPNGQSINFYIMSGNPSTAFTIEPNVGAIFINNQTAIDAYSWYYTLTVRLRYSKKVNGNTVIVADSMRTIRILNLVEGKSIGTFLATDPDANQTLNYYFMSGNYSTAFKINSAGKITISNPTAIKERMKTYDRYTINVRVRDNGVPYKESFANATILLYGNSQKKDVFNCR